MIADLEVPCRHCGRFPIVMLEADHWYDWGWCPECGTLHEVDTYGGSGKAFKPEGNPPLTVLHTTIPERAS